MAPLDDKLTSVTPGEAYATRRKASQPVVAR